MYYKEQFNDYKGNIKKTWSLLREVTKKSKDKSCVIDEIIVEDNKIHDHTNKINAMSRSCHFCFSQRKQFSINFPADPCGDFC